MLQYPFSVCGKTCTGDQCNAAAWNDLGKLLSPEKTVDSGVDCIYIERGANGAVGPEACKSTSVESSLVSKCPEYADAACASTSSAHFLGAELVQELHKERIQLIFFLLFLEIFVFQILQSPPTHASALC